MSPLAILDQPRSAPPLGPALAGVSAAAPGMAAVEDSATRLVDAFGRRLTYLRVSVTDRCNLRCTYCLPEDADFPFGDRDFLSPDEIAAMVGALVRLGIRRVRLTGGEPLVRKDLLEIVRRLKALPGLENLALSTNGTELARLAPALKAAGVDRVNISVDTLDAERFRAITRRGDVAEVWRGVEAALAAGLDPVKLNAVLLQSSRDDLERLAALTLDRPLHMRFIEMMPTGTNQHLQPGELLSADAARAALERRFGPLAAVEAGELGPRTGPAKAFRFPGAVGTVGFITPLSHTFCAECNRLRLTARGELRLCLFADRSYPLRPLLAAADADAALEAEILRVLAEKPAEHMLTAGNFGNLMSFMQIGG
jgi:cyclic pyranopterin phosphate synthase